MSELFGVDVSSYQGKVDWNKAKASGVQFAILKIIRKDLTLDNQFENNWKGCTEAGLEIQGVYNYSYATTVAKAKTDAKRVVEALAGRKTFVWLDVEDACQKGLKSTLIELIKAYQTIIENAGLSFGVYTGQYFYNTFIKPYGTLDCSLWIASYGTNNGKPQLTRKPSLANCIGWQYSSKGVVPGISGYCDVNTFTAGSNGIIIKKNPVAAVPTIKKGSKGTQALTLQKDLNCMGAKLTEDGIFGAKSVEALKAWQTKNGLKADGIYGSASYKVMKNLL